MWISSSRKNNRSKEYVDADELQKIDIKKCECQPKLKCLLISRSCSASLRATCFWSWWGLRVQSIGWRETEEEERRKLSVTAVCHVVLLFPMAAALPPEWTEPQSNELIIGLLLLSNPEVQFHRFEEVFHESATLSTTSGGGDAERRSR